jgi:hypothetical protein
MTGFKGRLLNELVTYVEQQPATDTPVRAAPRHRRRLVGLTAAAILVLAIAAGAVLGSPHSSPAYAVTTNADGTVTFTVHDFADPAAATAALQRAGVRGKVLKASSLARCPVPFPHLANDDRVDMGKVLVVHSDSSFTIRPDAIPSGHTVLFVMVGRGAGLHVVFGIALDPPPTCVAIEDEGPFPPRPHGVEPAGSTPSAR